MPRAKKTTDTNNNELAQKIAELESEFNLKVQRRQDETAKTEFRTLSHLDGLIKNIGNTLDDITSTGTSISRGSNGVELTGNALTDEEFNQQSGQLKGEINFHKVRQLSAKRTQESLKADTEEKKIEIYQHRLIEAQYQVDTAQIDAQIAGTERDTKLIELGITQDKGYLLSEKRELLFQSGIEDLKSLSLDLDKKVFDNNYERAVLMNLGAETTERKFASKNDVKKYLLSGE